MPKRKDPPLDPITGSLQVARVTGVLEPQLVRLGGLCGTPSRAGEGMGAEGGLGVRACLARGKRPGCGHAAATPGPPLPSMRGSARQAALLVASGVRIDALRKPQAPKRFLTSLSAL